MIWMPTRQKPAEWDLHLRSNAFGLLIGDDPSHLEFTNELGVFRGGDGGTALDVGPGRLVEWLTLASSYWVKRPEAEIYRICIRRAYSLFQ